MRCVAAIQATRPGIDSILLWDDNDRLIAIAYQDGKVMMTRPLQADTLEDAATETLQAFQIPNGNLTRIADYTATTTVTPVTQPSRRWQITR
jgi:hypothetical protein